MISSQDFVNEKVNSFKEKTSEYDKDKGFIVFVEGYDNQDFDIDLMLNFLRTALVETYEKGYNDGYEKAKSQSPS